MDGILATISSVALAGKLSVPLVAVALILAGRLTIRSLARKRRL
jgi:hypothetical protein